MTPIEAAKFLRARYLEPDGGPGFREAAHGEGRDAGDRVSLDQQVSGSDARRLK